MFELAVPDGGTDLAGDRDPHHRALHGALLAQSTARVPVELLGTLTALLRKPSSR
jgi:hypothetical protein